MTQEPTLRNVAERAGVSIGTASGVFSHKPSVSQRARAAVLAAADELGYTPRRRHRRAATSDDGIVTIGLVSRVAGYPGSRTPFYGPVLQGAESACRELGVSLVFELLRPDDPQPGSVPLSVERRRVQGMLLMGYMEPAYIEDILRAGIPCVLVNHFDERLPVDSVCDDDVRGGYLATSHLLDLGHLAPPPATITGPKHLRSIGQRLEGYRLALRERGLEPDPAYVRTAAGLLEKDGYGEMAALLELPEPPTAVVCCNDFTALGALELLRERGVAVPQQCAVVGYEDIDMAEHAVPPLTTVAVDQALLGMQGVWHLVERIRHPEIALRATRLSVSLVPRATTAPPPGAGR